MHDSKYEEWDTIHARELEEHAQKLSHAAAVFGILLILFSLAYGWMGVSFVVSTTLSLLFTLVVINRADSIADTPRDIACCRASFVALFAAQMLAWTTVFVDAIKG